MEIINANNTDLKHKGLIGIAGTSGSGKSTTAVMLANAIAAEKNMNLFLDSKTNKPNPKYFKKHNGAVVITDFTPTASKVGIIDLEHGRALQTANQVLEYKDYGAIRIGASSVIELNSEASDLLIKDMLEAKRMLVESGCEVIVVDSMSVFWDWIKIQQELLTGGDAKKGMSAWGTINKDYMKVFTDEFIKKGDETIIFTFRAKSQSILPVDAKKAQEIALGIDYKNASIEYDLTTLFTLSLSNQGMVENVFKDNSGLILTDSYINPTIGRLYEKWLERKLDTTFLAKYNLQRLKAIDENRFGVFFDEWFNNNGIKDKNINDLDELQLKSLEIYMTNALK